MSGRSQPKRPLSKATQALLADLQRRRNVRTLARRFLIVCEDNKSAPTYFEALKKHLNLAATSVQVAGSEGDTQPIQVVERAISLKEEAVSSRSGTEPFDQVWCVIDGDYGDKIQQARAKARANEIELAISTKCFEYWVLLHFEECDTSTLDCDGVIRNLRKRHLKEYQKGKCDFQAIVVNVHVASERAERLRKPGIRRNDLPEIQNPCSEIYILVKAILKSKDDVDRQVPPTATPTPQQGQHRRSPSTPTARPARRPRRSG